MNKTNTRLLCFILIITFAFSTLSPTFFGNAKANDYPGSGNWTIWGYQEKKIDSNTNLVGNIYLYGNLTIENAKITINTNVYQIWCYQNSNLTIRNATIEGSNGGGVQIVFHGAQCNMYNSTFKSLSTGAIIAQQDVNISKCIFDTLSSDIITVQNPDSKVFDPINITECTFKNSPSVFAVNIEGSESMNELNANISYNSINNVGGFKLFSIESATLNNNTFIQAKYKAIDLVFCPYAQIQSNSFTQTPFCIHILACFSVNISFNILNSINNIGIRFQACSDLTINSNDITMTDGVGILDENENDQRTWIRNTDINMSSATNDMEAIALGKSPYQTLMPARFTFIENTTRINNVFVKSFYNLSNQVIDFTGQTISKFIAVNCTDMVFQNLNVSYADGIFLSSLANCTFHDIVANNNFFSGITTELCYKLNITQFNCSNNRNIGVRDNTEGTYMEFPYHPSNNWNIFSQGTISENGREGIRANREKFLRLHNLTLSKNKWHGIDCSENYNATFTNLTIIENEFSGININYGYNTTIQYCNLLMNKQSNVVINYMADAVKIYDSELKKNRTAPNVFNILTQTDSAIIDHNHYSDYTGFDDDNNKIGDVPYKANSSYSGTDVFDNNPWFHDDDNDNVDRFVEENYDTNSSDSDTDSDGLTDYQEIFAIRHFNAIEYTFIISPTNPLVNDTDKDGLTDSTEMITHKTNPNSADSDQDGYSDKEEIDASSDPLDPSDWPGRSSQQYSFEDIDDKQKEAEADRSVQSIPGYPINLMLIVLPLAIIFFIRDRKKKLRNSADHQRGGVK